MSSNPSQLDSTADAEIAAPAQGGSASDRRKGGDQKRRQAILVIHGIGRQARFQTLDRFANGLCSVLPSVTVVHIKVAHGQTQEDFVRLESDRILDIFEFYWAPLAVDKTSFVAMARWLYETGFAPFKRLAFNLPLLIHRARENSKKPDSSLRVWLASLFGGTKGFDISWLKFVFLVVWYSCLEVLRVVSILLISLSLAGLAVALVANSKEFLTSLTEAFNRIEPSSLHWESYLIMLIFVGTVVAATALILSLPKQLRDLVRVCRISPKYVWRLDTFGNVSLILFIIRSIPRILVETVKDLFGKLIRRSQAPSGSPKAVRNDVAQAETTPPTQGEDAGGHSQAPDRLSEKRLAAHSPDANISKEQMADDITSGVKAGGVILSFLYRKFAPSIRRWAEDRQNTRRWRAEIAGRALFLMFSVLVLLPLGWLLLRLLGPDPVSVFGYRLSGVVYTLGTQLGKEGLWSITWISLLLLSGLFLKRVFVDYMADIALYTTADENSPFAKTRCEILNEATRKLRWLLQHYDSVAIAGHSLGSVIGYDVINRLRMEVQIENDLAQRKADSERQLTELLNTVSRDTAGQILALIDQMAQQTEKDISDSELPINSETLGRLQTFITFGSPLNKVLYFFRTTVKPYESIRAHILTDLHGFRRPAELLTSDPDIRHGSAFGNSYESEDASSIPLNSVFWLNVYCPLDPVSARLFFYEKIWEYRRWYLLPGFCHMSYWYDRTFYEEVLAALDKTPKRAKLRTAF